MEKIVKMKLHKFFKKEKDIYEKDEECRAIADAITKMCYGGVMVEKEKFYSDLYKQFSKEKVDAVMRDLHNRDLMREYVGPRPLKEAHISINDKRHEISFTLYPKSNDPVYPDGDYIGFAVSPTLNLHYCKILEWNIEKHVCAMIIREFLPQEVVMEFYPDQTIHEEDLHIEKDIITSFERINAQEIKSKVIQMPDNTYKIYVKGSIPNTVASLLLHHYSNVFNHYGGIVYREVKKTNEEDFYFFPNADITQLENIVFGVCELSIEQTSIHLPNDAVKEKVIKKIKEILCEYKFV